MQCHCINHVKDFILGLFGGDGFHIGDINIVFFQCVAEKFFQLFVDIFHVITGFTDKERIGISCNIFSVSADSSLDPAGECRLILTRKFHDASVFFHLLVHLCFLVYFFFRKDKISGFRNGRHVIGKFFGAFFKQTAVFDQNESAVGKKRQCLCQIDDLFLVDVAAGESRKVHGIIIRCQCML